MTAGMSPCDSGYDHRQRAQRGTCGIKMKILPSGWADAAVIIPWKMYLYYGDEDIIRCQFASMKAWIDYMAAHTTDHVFGDKLQMGDWVALDASEGSYFGATPTELTCMAYNAYVAKLFSKMADIIGEKEISRTYRQQYEDIREAFIKEIL